MSKERETYVWRGRYERGREDLCVRILRMMIDEHRGERIDLGWL